VHGRCLSDGWLRCDVWRPRRRCSARGARAEVLGGRAPVGPGPREQEPGSWEPERRARVVAVRSAAAVAVAVSVCWAGSRFDSGACGTGLVWGAECSRGAATAGLGGVTGIGSAGGATAGFGEPVFGGFVIGPEEGLGSLPGAMLAGVGSGFHAAVNLT
jgi:hypothetical protein